MPDAKSLEATPMKMKTPKSNRGSTLFAVLFFMVMLSLFAGAAFNYSSGTAMLGDRSTIQTQGYGVADAAMEIVYARWRQILKTTDQNVSAHALVTPGENSLNMDITVVDMVGLGMPTDFLNLGAGFSPRITIQVLDVYGKTFDVAYPVLPGPNPVAPPGVDITTAGYTFKTKLEAANDFIATTLTYEVVVQFTVPSRSGDVPIKLTRHFQRLVAPALQAAIFFENRLEIFPGSNMTISGAVHTNGSFYQGTYNSAVDLEFLKRVTYVNNYNSNASATTTVVQPGYVTGGGGPFTDASLVAFDPLVRFQGNAGNAPQVAAAMTIGGIDRGYLQAYDATNNPSYNNNSLREIIEQPVRRSGMASDPSSTLFNDYWNVPTAGDAATNQATIETSRVYNQASIKINLVYNTTTGVLDPSQTEIRATTPTNMADGPLMSTVNGALNTAILAALNKETGGTTRIGVKDARENSRNSALPDIKTTTLDVGDLRQAIIDSGYDFNGILYIADVTGRDPNTLSYNNSGTDVEMSGGNRVKHAIMLTDGANLPGSQISDLTAANRAFTVVSENAVYIKGDYNTGGTGAAVPANSGAIGDPTVAAGYTSVTSAVMADAVSVVSSKFDPTHGYDDLRQIAASTFNPAYAMALNSAGVEVNPTATGFDPATATNQFSRQAVSTTVNTAVVSGIFQNTDTSVGGGASNMIRFMENWNALPTGTYTPDMTTGLQSLTGSTKFTYNGSLMQSFFSKEFTSSWTGPAAMAAYNAPVRVVNFDQSFLDRTPPGSPDTKTYVKGDWQRDNGQWERERVF